MLPHMALPHSFLWLGNIHSIYVSHLLYLIIHLWTFRLLPCLCDYKYCCYKYRDACIFSNYSFSLFQIYAKEWDCLQNLHPRAVRAPGRELTLAASEMESQFPPERAYFPLPILAKMSSGVSSGPFAKGVNLCDERFVVSFHSTICGKARCASLW